MIQSGTAPWQKYYHTLTPSSDGQPGVGEEVWTVQGDDEADWWVARPDRGLVTVHFRNNHRTSRNAGPNMVCTSNPEPTPEEKRALVLALS